jgi:hypothetical protein
MAPMITGMYEASFAQLAKVLENEMAAEPVADTDATTRRTISA